MTRVHGVEHAAAGAADQEVSTNASSVVSPAPSNKSAGLYDTLVRTGIEKRMTSNEKELNDLKDQLAKLEALKKSSNGSGESNTETIKAETTRGIIVEREPENLLDVLMDDIFAEMFAEMKGYRPTKAEITAFKSTQMDDYDAELEEFECEAYDQDDGEDEYYPEYDEYAYEEAERQRLLQEMLESEESFDVTTHGAVFFDVTPDMQQLSLKDNKDNSNASAEPMKATGPIVGSFPNPALNTGNGSTRTSRLIIEDAKTTGSGEAQAESMERTLQNVSNFKLNAAAKEWKPPGMAE